MGAISTAAAWRDKVEGGRGKNFPLMQKFFSIAQKMADWKGVVESTEKKPDIARLSPKILLANLPKYRANREFTVSFSKVIKSV